MYYLILRIRSKKPELFCRDRQDAVKVSSYTQHYLAPTACERINMYTVTVLCI